MLDHGPTSTIAPSTYNPPACMLYPFMFNVTECQWGWSYTYSNALHSLGWHRPQLLDKCHCMHLVCHCVIQTENMQHATNLSVFGHTVVMRGRLLAVSHCRGNKSKVNHWILRQTYQLHQYWCHSWWWWWGGGGGGARCPIEWQPVTASPQSFSKDGRATDSCFDWGSSVWRTDG